MNQFDDYETSDEVFHNEMELLDIAKTLKKHGFTIGTMSIEKFVLTHIHEFERISLKNK